MEEKFNCVNDQYDPGIDTEPYTLEEFLAMCQECFGEEPDLFYCVGEYVDSNGDTVLTPAN
jgi:hypothetical protein